MLDLYLPEQKLHDLLIKIPILISIKTLYPII